MSANNFAPEYIDVGARLVGFREKHPEGSLQPADLASPFQVITVGGDDFIVVVAAAYRAPDDARPGVGMAYEPYPGKTPYTRGSELQNAETSAWGRAIMAALAGDSRRGIASAEEVRNRGADEETRASVDPRAALWAEVKQAREAKGWSSDDVAADFAGWSQGVSTLGEADAVGLARYIRHLQAVAP
jgi:hypothetical protein